MTYLKRLINIRHKYSGIGKKKKVAKYDVAVDTVEL